MKYKFTDYFENEVLRKRAYLKREWCTQIIENSIRSEQQDDTRVRFWGKIEEHGGRYLRVVTLLIELLYTMRFLTGVLNHED